MVYVKILFFWQQWLGALIISLCASSMWWSFIQNLIQLSEVWVKFELKSLNNLWTKVDKLFQTQNFLWTYGFIWSVNQKRLELIEYLTCPWYRLSDIFKIQCMVKRCHASYECFNNKQHKLLIGKMKILRCTILTGSFSVLCPFLIPRPFWF